MEILLFAALLPAIVLMVYVYRKDVVEQEPVGLVARLFVLGAVAGPLAAITENLLFMVFESVLPPGMLLLFFEFFIGVAAVEEGFKYLFLNTVRHNPEFNYVFDGIVYAVAVALGFAALENVLYVFDGGIEVAISRAIFAVPGHAADGVVMGCFYGLARRYEAHGEKSKAFTHRVLAFLLPTLEHGLYDFSLSTGSETFAILGLGMGLVFIFIGGLLVKRMSARDMAINPTAASALDETTPLYPAPTEHPQQYTVSLSTETSTDDQGWSYPDFGRDSVNNGTKQF